MPVTDKSRPAGVYFPPPGSEEEVTGIRCIARLMGKTKIVITWRATDLLGYCTCSRETHIAQLTLKDFIPWMGTDTGRFVYDGYDLLP